MFANHAHSAFESHRDQRVERPKGGKMKVVRRDSFPGSLIARAGSTGEVAGPRGCEAWSRGLPDGGDTQQEGQGQALAGALRKVPRSVHPSLTDSERGSGTVGESGMGSRPGAPRSVPSATPHSPTAPMAPTAQIRCCQGWDQAWNI